MEVAALFQVDELFLKKYPDMPSDWPQAVEGALIIAETHPELSQVLN